MIKLKNLLTEFDDKIPAGYKVIKKTVTVKSITKRPGSGINWNITGKHYDDYLGDQLGAVELDIEDEVAAFRKNKYSDEEIEKVYNDLKTVKFPTTYDLPKPMKIQITVLKHK